MTDQEVLENLKSEMDESLGAFRRDLAKIRTGRATTALLDGIQADYYGSKTPLKQLAQVTAPEPRLLVVQPYDKAALIAIEKAIQQSDLGLNPLNDGKILRLPIPELTEERRKDIVRQTRKKVEDYRVELRRHRHEALEFVKEMLKDRELTEDDAHRVRERIEAETKTYLEHVEEGLKKKEQEILTV